MKTKKKDQDVSIDYTVPPGHCYGVNSREIMVTFLADSLNFIVTLINVIAPTAHILEGLFKAGGVKYKARGPKLGCLTNFQI